MGGLKEVNASLTRLDRKILHLETLLAKLTDRLSLQAAQAAVTAAAAASSVGQACHVVVDDDQANSFEPKNPHESPVASIHSRNQDESSKM